MTPEAPGQAPPNAARPDRPSIPDSGWQTNHVRGVRRDSRPRRDQLLGRSLSAEPPNQQSSLLPGQDGRPPRTGQVTPQEVHHEDASREQVQGGTNGQAENHSGDQDTGPTAGEQAAQQNRDRGHRFRDFIARRFGRDGSNQIPSANAEAAVTAIAAGPPTDQWTPVEAPAYDAEGYATNLTTAGPAEEPSREGHRTILPTDSGDAADTRPFVAVPNGPVPGGAPARESSAPWMPTDLRFGRQAPGGAPDSRAGSAGPGAPQDLRPAAAPFWEPTYTRRRHRRPAAKPAGRFDTSAVAVAPDTGDGPAGNRDTTVIGPAVSGESHLPSGDWEGSAPGSGSPENAAQAEGKRRGLIGAYRRAADRVLNPLDERSKRRAAARDTLRAQTGYQDIVARKINEQIGEGGDPTQLKDRPLRKIRRAAAKEFRAQQKAEAKKYQEDLQLLDRGLNRAIRTSKAYTDRLAYWTGQGESAKVANEKAYNDVKASETDTYKEGIQYHIDLKRRAEGQKTVDDEIEDAKATDPNYQKLVAEKIGGRANLSPDELAQIRKDATAEYKNALIELSDGPNGLKAAIEKSEAFKLRYAALAAAGDQDAYNKAYNDVKASEEQKYKAAVPEAKAAYDKAEAEKAFTHTEQQIRYPDRQMGIIITGKPGEKFTFDGNKLDPRHVGGSAIIRGASGGQTGREICITTDEDGVHLITNDGKGTITIADFDDSNPPLSTITFGETWKIADLEIDIDNIELKSIVDRSGFRGTAAAPGTKDPFITYEGILNGETPEAAADAKAADGSVDYVQLAKDNADQWDRIKDLATFRTKLATEIDNLPDDQLGDAENILIGKILSGEMARARSPQIYKAARVDVLLSDGAPAAGNAESAKAFADKVMAKALETVRAQDKAAAERAARQGPDARQQTTPSNADVLTQIARLLQQQREGTVRTPIVDANSSPQSAGQTEIMAQTLSLLLQQRANATSVGNEAGVRTIDQAIQGLTGFGRQPETGTAPTPRAEASTVVDTVGARESANEILLKAGIDNADIAKFLNQPEGRPFLEALANNRNAVEDILQLIQTVPAHLEALASTGLDIQDMPGIAQSLAEGIIAKYLREQPANGEGGSATGRRGMMVNILQALVAGLVTAGIAIGRGGIEGGKRFTAAA